MAPRMTPASRLIGIRRGCSTIRRKTANTTSASTRPENRSMAPMRRLASTSPISSRQANDGNSPWISVSTEPRVMMMKPQKMKKWYLLPSALTKAGQRFAGSTVFSTTFFCPKK